MRAAATETVLRDLVDTLVQEDLAGFGTRAEARGPWCRVKLPIGEVSFRLRDGGALQEHRYAGGDVWFHAEGAEPVAVRPAELLELICGDFAGSCEVANDLRAAVSHTEVLAVQRAELDLAPRPGVLLAGERLAATRNRPFHPTARAASGWSPAELIEHGPMRAEPLGLDWVALRADRVRSGGDPDRLPELVLAPGELRELTEARQAAGVAADHVVIPVHPWQFEHALPSWFGDELADGSVVPVARGLGRFHPTASIRTLVTDPESEHHVKLPLGMATLGATRLLPPRYLANSARAEDSVRELVERDPVLRERVELCDERTWCGWHDPDDEFGDRPGHLAAQLRTYPRADGLVLPMAALAAHEWDVLAPAIGQVFDPLLFFAELAREFCTTAVGFLRHGVLPELHGQNVVVQLEEGRVRRFVLRDHDTVRLHPDWMRRAGARDPEYLIKPGAPQSLCLDSAEELVGYLQTLGFQVNLYGIADALCAHFGLDERDLWAQLRDAVRDCLAAQPAELREVLRDRFFDAETWPSRQVLGPLLRRGRSSGVSMPASTGTVPNPLRAEEQT
ncbi:staphyloferrin B biosynthesis protein SbnC [Saccharopolyspora halophila]|uniref:Staphyloferrin B biosynthesis protein SbnC n=1 Tax=Saccharopolyspora halophila TaxID=405551 RepID=A0ABN3GT27_9PSEU